MRTAWRRFVAEALRRAAVAESVSWQRQRLCTDSTARGQIDQIRKKAARATPEELLSGLKVVQKPTETHAARSYADLEFLGKGIHDTAASLEGIQLVEVLQCYARMQYVRTEWIARLVRCLQPVVLSQRALIRCIAALGTLQRLYNRQTAPRHGLFVLEHLPSFVPAKHKQLFPNQSSILHQLLQRMQLSDAGLHHRDVTTLVYSLSQLAPLDASSSQLACHLIDGLMERGSHDEEPLGIASVSVLLYSLSQLDVRDPSILRFLLKELLKEVAAVGAFPLERISMVLYSLAKLRVHDRGIMLRLLQEAQYAGRLGHFSAWDLSSLLYSLARLRFRGSHAAISQLGHEIARSRRLSTFSEQGLTLVLYGLGQIQFRHISVIQSVLDEALKPFRIEELTYQGLCMMVHGLSKLPQSVLQSLKERHQMLLQLLADTIHIRMEAAEKLAPSGVVSLLFGSFLSQSHLKPSEVQNLLEQFFQMADGFGESFLSSLSPKELQILVKCLSKLGYRDGNTWSRILAHVEQRMESRGLDKPLIAAIAFSCTHPSLSTLPAARHCRDRCLREAVGRSGLKELSETDLVCLMECALGVVENRGPMLSELLTEISQPDRLREFTPHHVVTLISLLLQPSVEPPEKERVLNALKLQTQLTEVDASGLVTVLYHFSRHRPRDHWMEALLSEVKRRSGFYASLKPSELSMMMESLSHLRISDPVLLNPLFHELSSPEKLRHMEDRSLILLMHACMKLGTRRLIPLLIQELHQRRNVSDLPLDLLSMMLYTLGRCGIYDQTLFERAFHRLDSVETQSLSTLAAVNILDAVGRLGLNRRPLTEQLVDLICHQGDPLTLREAHQFFHAVGRLRVQTAPLLSFLHQFVRSDHAMHSLDAAAMAGLVYAAAEAGLHDAASTDVLLSKALSSAMLQAYQEGHLCSLAYRLHIFHPSSDALFSQFAERIEAQLRSGGSFLTKLGQVVIGFGKLAEKYPDQTAFAALLHLMAEDWILNAMPTGDLIGHIVAASACPHTTLALAQKTAAYMLRHGCLYSCTDKEVKALKRAIKAFNGQLGVLESALAVVNGR